MYSAEQLGPPTAYQKQNFFLNLRELYQAHIKSLPLGPGEELAIYQKKSEAAMSLGYNYHDLSDYGQQISTSTEISTDEKMELTKYVKCHLSDLQTSVDTGTSEEVGDYQDLMEILYEDDTDARAKIPGTYDDTMQALEANFMAITNAELAQHVSLTGRLIDRHIKVRYDRPTTN